MGEKEVVGWARGDVPVSRCMVYRLASKAMEGMVGERREGGTNGIQREGRTGCSSNI
jgi:hypothetical protein